MEKIREITLEERASNILQSLIGICQSNKLQKDTICLFGRDKSIVQSYVGAIVDMMGRLQIHHALDVSPCERPRKLDPSSYYVDVDGFELLEKLDDSLFHSGKPSVIQRRLIRREIPSSISNLGDALSREDIRDLYFQSEFPLSGHILYGRFYRVAMPLQISKPYIKIVPASSVQTSDRDIIMWEMEPVSVFLSQHYEDRVVRPEHIK